MINLRVSYRVRHDGDITDSVFSLALPPLDLTEVQRLWLRGHFPTFFPAQHRVPSQLGLDPPGLLPPLHSIYSIDRLCDDELETIISYLAPIERFRLGWISHRFRYVSSKDYLWVSRLDNTTILSDIVTRLEYRWCPLWPRIALRDSTRLATWRRRFLDEVFDLWPWPRSRTIDGDSDDDEEERTVEEKRDRYGCARDEWISRTTAPFRVEENFFQRKRISFCGCCESRGTYLEFKAKESCWFYSIFILCFPLLSLLLAFVVLLIFVFDSFFSFENETPFVLSLIFAALSNLLILVSVIASIYFYENRVPKWLEERKSGAMERVRDLPKVFLGTGENWWFRPLPNRVSSFRYGTLSQHIEKREKNDLICSARAPFSIVGMMILMMLLMIPFLISMIHFVGPFGLLMLIPSDFVILLLFGCYHNLLMRHEGRIWGNGRFGLTNRSLFYLFLIVFFFLLVANLGCVFGAMKIDLGLNSTENYVLASLLSFFLLLTVLSASFSVFLFIDSLCFYSPLWCFRSMYCCNSCGDWVDSVLLLECCGSSTYYSRRNRGTETAWMWIGVSFWFSLIIASVLLSLGVLWMWDAVAPWVILVMAIILVFIGAVVWLLKAVVEVGLDLEKEWALSIANCCCWKR